MTTVSITVFLFTLVSILASKEEGFLICRKFEDEEKPICKLLLQLLIPALATNSNLLAENSNAVSQQGFVRLNNSMKLE